jgi:hypothetical protein
MKYALVAACGFAWITAALAQQGIKYSPGVSVMRGGTYRAEVWRFDAGQRELAYTSDSHPNADAAMEAACSTVKEHYDASIVCASVASASEQHAAVYEPSAARSTEAAASAPPAIKKQLPEPSTATLARQEPASASAPAALPDKQPAGDHAALTPVRPLTVLPQPATKRPSTKEQTASPSLEKSSGVGHSAGLTKSSTAPEHTGAQLPAHKSKAVAAKAASRIRKVVVVGKLVSPAATGYEVPGCTYYTLEEGRVTERCTATGSPSHRDFWRNYERLIGNSGADGSGGGGGGSD